MRTYLAALLLLAGANPATAEDYTLIIHESAGQLALRTDTGAKGAAYWGGYAAIGQELAKAGVLKGGAALDPGPAAKGDRIGGYFVIAVPDRASALAWAAKVPAAKVDVRAHVPTPTGM